MSPLQGAGAGLRSPRDALPRCFWTLLVLKIWNENISAQFYIILASFVFRLLVIEGKNPSKRTTYGIICGIALPIPTAMMVSENSGSWCGKKVFNWRDIIISNDLSADFQLEYVFHFRSPYFSLGQVMRMHSNWWTHSTRNMVRIHTLSQVLNTSKQSVIDSLRVKKMPTVSRQWPNFSLWFFLYRSTSQLSFFGKNQWNYK